MRSALVAFLCFLSWTIDLAMWAGLALLCWHFAPDPLGPFLAVSVSVVWGGIWLLDTALLAIDMAGAARRRNDRKAARS
ncbi:hypothetical protein [Nonomuraea sp. NPDC050643]|uniref:hypothetical protein n=1 Tax=Nonomuraea sp. NPDC050643 TaxID=3155660 RepID=UPI0034069085